MAHRLSRDTVYFIYLFFILSCSTLWAQQAISTNDFVQWRKCWLQQISLWDGAASYCIEMGKVKTNEIYLTNLYNYSYYMYKLGSPNIIKCPSGVPYKQSFTLETGPYCPVHPITGAELISPFIIAKGTTYKYEDSIRLLKKGNPTGARRWGLLAIPAEDARKHESEMKQILTDALSDNDEILRYIAQEKIEEFQKEKILWVVALTNTIDRIQSKN